MGGGYEVTVSDLKRTIYDRDEEIRLLKRKVEVLKGDVIVLEYKQRPKKSWLDILLRIG